MAHLDFKLLAWQQEVISSTAKYRVVCAGRRSGKSRDAACELIIEGLKCPKGSGVMYVAPTQGQARVIIWELLMDLGREVISHSHVNNMEITLVNGCTIYIRGADRPDTLRGMDLWFVVLDEYADMKPMVWETVIQASLARHNGRALFIGTPKGRNHFYDIYQKGLNDNEKEWKSWLFFTADNEFIKPEVIEEAKRTLSTFAFKQEYMASFDNAGTNVFKEEWLKYGSEPKEGSFFIAIDLAGFEAVGQNAQKAKKRLDQCAIAVVKLTEEGKWFVRKIEFGRWDIRETAVRILKNIREFKPQQMGIEKGSLYNAVTPYLTDLMRKNNIYAHVEPLTHGNQNKNDRIVWALQGMFEHGRIILNEDEKWDEFKDEYLMFPTANVHDDCFPADAPIITKEGVKQISEVTTDDYVLTRNGYQKVLKAWCKGYQKVITRFGITATPDHRVWTENKGWVTLDSICENDILLTSTVKEISCESGLNSMGVSTTDIQMRNKQTIEGISHHTPSGKKHLELCTVTFGNSTTDKSQLDTMSITQMVTSTTIPLKTLSAYPQRLIKLSIEKKEAKELNQINIFPTLSQLGRSLKSGTPPKKEENGTQNTPSSLLPRILTKNLALNADHYSNQESQSKYSAKTQSVNGNESIENNENAIPVYDLMVENEPEFFAYGVLVHNCIDSLSMIQQLVVTNYMVKDDDEQEYEPIDIISGY